MRILFCNINGVNANFRIDQEPLNHKVSATAVPVIGKNTVTDFFESKVILGGTVDKSIFITTQTGTAINGTAVNSSITQFRDASLLKSMKADYIKKYGQEKWDIACKKAGGEEELFKLIRGFSSNIATKKSDYIAWHNGSPSVTGTKDLNKDDSFSVQELGYNQTMQKAPQYCIPLNADGAIDIAGMEPTPSPEITSQVKGSNPATTASDPSVGQLLSKPGYRFDYATFNKDYTTASYNLHYESPDGKQQGSVEARVTFGLDPAGKLTVTVISFKDGSSTLFADEKDIRAVIAKLAKDGTIMSTGANTSADNGVSFSTKIDNYRPGFFENRDGKTIPVMIALAKFMGITP